MANSVTHFADRWTDPNKDACCGFFSACLKQARYDIPFGGRVLEIGCAEFNWIAHLREQCPDMEVTGIDWRKTDYGIQGDVLTYDFPENHFDAVVSISAIEHIGLGHYDNDPVNPAGDILTIARVWRWLKPGGILYFDVPFNPMAYRVVGTSHREYDLDALFERLWIGSLVKAEGMAKWLWDGYAPAKHTARVQTERPIDPEQPFWYVGLVWQKVG